MQLEPVEIEGALGSPVRRAEADQVGAIRAGYSPGTQLRHKVANTAGRRRLRDVLSPEQRDDARERNRAALTAAEKAVINAARRQTRDAGHGAKGPSTAAAPNNMPSDAYLDTFENNPIAARALFWAHFGNWSFARWRNTSDAAVRAELNMAQAERDAEVGGAGVRSVQYVLTCAERAACMMRP